MPAICCRMADCRRASRAETQGWPAVDGLLSACVGTAEAVGTLGRGLGGSSGGGSLAIEVAKAHSLDRGVVPGRRARQLWLQPASWLCCPVCAHQQPAGVRKRGSWTAVGLGEAWLCGRSVCCACWSECRLCCLPQAHPRTNVRAFLWTFAHHYAPLLRSPLASLVRIIW